MRPVTVGNPITAESVAIGPSIIRAVVSAEQSIDPRQVHGEVLVAGISVRAVMPVMKTRCHDHVLDTAEAEPHVGMDENRVKRDEDQIGVDRTAGEAE